MMTTPPKILPWLARRAGIADDAALAAWRDALAAADHRFGGPADTPQYWNFVAASLRRRIDAARRTEGRASGVPLDAGPALRLQARLAAVGFEAAFGLTRILLRTGWGMGQARRRPRAA